ncbi:MAG TPA: hypothetical protein PKH77_03340 [Anaerolineae bacterium]|nr:hypothetical protein [Anaerolineae bacterium]
MESAVACIVAQPGPMRSSLQMLMTTMPQVAVVNAVGDAGALLGLGNEQQPDLILLDPHRSDTPVSNAVQQIQSRCPQTRCLVLADSVQQQQEAEAAGAHRVLLKGLSGARLSAAIEGLLTG